MSPSGAMTTYPTPNFQTWGITIGPDGNVWFTKPDNEVIARLAR
jgi:streptogramin lyase